MFVKKDNKDMVYRIRYIKLPYIGEISGIAKSHEIIQTGLQNLQ